MSERKKVSLPYLFKKVANNEPITMLTCYDYPTAHFQEIAEATQKLCALAPQIPG
jgi:ketopantoate hydroxymethyltransferase